MNPVRLFAFVLLAGGILGLMYGGFTYTKDTHETKLGPIALTVKDTQTVNIPVWVGAAAIAAGLMMLLVRLDSKKG